MQDNGHTAWITNLLSYNQFYKKGLLTLSEKPLIINQLGFCLVVELFYLRLDSFAMHNCNNHQLIIIYQR